jgi:hypothetical protein
VLKSGSADEQIASMPYLVGYAEKQEIEQLTALLDSAYPMCSAQRNIPSGHYRSTEL